MNDIQILTQDAEAHKGLVMALGMWAIREVPVVTRWFKTTAWPMLINAYPYCRDNGGVKGIIKNFFAGKQQTTENK